MSTGVFRNLAAGLLGGALFALPTLPPEHCHPGDHDHPGIVHRHMAPHTGHPASNAVFDNDDDDDGVVVWIDGSFIVGVPTRLAPPDASEIVDARLEPLLLSSQGVVPEFRARCVHDPPRWLTSPRGPPAFASL